MSEIEIIKALKRGLTQSIAGLRQAVSSLDRVQKDLEQTDDMKGTKEHGITPGTKTGGPQP